MKILIDGDACPVISICEKECKNKIEGEIYFDTAHVIRSDVFKCIMCDKGENSADFKLVNSINKGDIIVTNDIPLSSMCLGKGGKVINFSGEIINDSNIDKYLMMRFVANNERSKGTRTKGPKKRTNDLNIKFQNTLKSIIESSLND